MAAGGRIHQQAPQPLPPVAKAQALSAEHIGAVRRRCPDALIVGLWKRTYGDSPVYITPGWAEIQAVWGAGADVVAIDATERHRPGGQSLEELIRRATTDRSNPNKTSVLSDRS